MMLIAAKMTVISLIALLLIAVGAVAAEIALSRMESRWPGLVLPALFLLPAVFVLPNAVLTAAMAAASVQASAAAAVGNALLSALVMLLPSLVLLGIYFIIRRRMDRRKQVEKMNIQDL